jgi:isoleucyl-tRNA synthetase
MTRETDLIDVWFDSGSTVCTMALSFENEKIDQNQDFQLILLLKVDQTRGWFYTLRWYFY